MSPSPNLKLQAPQIKYSPALEGWPGAGVYQLWIRLNLNARITVGRSGRFVFPCHGAPAMQPLGGAWRATIQTPNRFSPPMPFMLVLRALGAKNS